MKKERVELNLEEIKKYYYNDNLSATKIAVKYNTNYAIINRFLKENNCKLKTLSELHRKFDEDVFENIDTEEKAYWLGYLFADGCIRHKTTKHKNGNIYNQYIISLTSIDKEVIVNFKKFLKSSNKLKNYKTISGYKVGNNYYVEMVSSYKMFTDLKNKNCKPNKTKDLHLPNNVPNHLINHFIRGYFDGDGTVYISKTGYEKLNVNIISTYNFCKFLKINIFPGENSETLLYKEKRIEQDNIYILKFDSNRAKAFYKYIYTNSTIYLNRKKDKFDEFLLKRGSTTIISNPNKI